MASEVIFIEFVVTCVLHTARISNVESTMCDNKVNKLTSVFYATVLLLMINFVITLSKCCRFTSRRRVDLQQTLTML